VANGVVDEFIAILDGLRGPGAIQNLRPPPPVPERADRASRSARSRVGPRSIERRSSVAGVVDCPVYTHRRTESAAPSVGDPHVFFGGRRIRTGRGRNDDESRFRRRLLQLNAEKQVPREQLIRTVEEAIAAAYRRIANEEDIHVQIDGDTGRIRVYRAAIARRRDRGRS
jgi:hypothetical protein